MLLLSVLLVLTAETPARAGEGAFYLLGSDTSAIEVLDGSTVHWDRGLRGAAVVRVLAEPVPDGGRMLRRVDVIRKWHCESKESRAMREIWRTQDGTYVRSKLVKEPWAPTAGQPHAEIARTLLCPGEQPARVRTFATLDEAVLYYLRARAREND